jgi:hypothetical protein
MGRNLGPLNIKDSYEGLVQISGSQLTDGSGSLIPSLDVSASFATTATSASHALNADNAISSSYALTASFAENVVSTPTGSFMVTGSVTDATLTFTKGDASTFPLTVNNVANAVSASHAVIADSALAAATATSASHAVSSDTSISASHAVNADSAISSSYATTASFAENVSTPNLQEVTDVGAITTNAITSSGAFLDGDVAISGDLDVNGTITYISSSTLQIGDNVIEINYNKAAGNSGILTYDTTSPFTASLLWDATADRWIAGPFGSEETIILSSDTGSMSVASASYATTASYAENVTTPTLQNVLDAGDTANADIRLTTTDNVIRTPNLEVYYTAGIGNFTKFTSSFGELTIEEDTEGFNFKSTPASGRDGIIAFTSGSGLSGQLLVINPTQNLITSNLPISASSYISASEFIGDGSGLTNLPGAAAFPYTGSAEITGSLGVTGSFEVDGIAIGNGGNTLNTIIGNGASAGTGTYNTYIGELVGRVNTSGFENTIVGTRAGYDLTTGFTNNFYGALAGQTVTTGDENQIFGGNALPNLSTGDQNIAIGHYTGQGITGDGNTIIGNRLVTGALTDSIVIGVGNGVKKWESTGGTTTIYEDATISGSAEITGSLKVIGQAEFASNPNSDITNTSIGAEALQSVGASTLGTTAIGYQAGKSIVNGSAGGYHTLIGWQNGRNINDGSYYTVGVGAYCLNSLTSGRDNTAVGATAGFALTTQEGNALFGKQAGQSLTGEKNAIIGRLAGQNLTSANNNTFVGESAGSGITTGDNNTVIGRATGLTSTLANNIILADGSGNIAYQYDNATTTTTFSGTIKQDVSALTITSNTASLDASVANMFTLTLQNAANTHLELSNQVAGQTFQIKITNNATAAGTITFDNQFEFEGGTAFTATAATNAVDILTLTCFGGNVQCVGSKNFS